MRELVNRRVETVDRYDVKITCDRCGKPAAHWRNNARFEIEEAHIEYESGTSYPECDRDTKFEGVDCCEECWDLVRASLVSLGFKVRAWEHGRKTPADYIEVG